MGMLFELLVCDSFSYKNTMVLTSFISVKDHMPNFEVSFLQVKKGKMIFHALSHLMQKATFGGVEILMFYR